MSWTNLFGSVEKEPVSEYLVQIDNLDVKQVLRKARCFRDIRTKDWVITPVNPAWVNYWPTFEGMILDNIKSLNLVIDGVEGYKNETGKIVLRIIGTEEPRTFKIDQPRHRFLELLKNSLDLEVVERRVKKLGYDPEFAITDVEYTGALNGIFDRKYNEHYTRMFRMNMGMLIFSVVMSSWSEQPGYYWGIMATSAFNLIRAIQTYPSRFSLKDE